MSKLFDRLRPSPSCEDCHGTRPLAPQNALNLCRCGCEKIYCLACCSRFVECVGCSNAFSWVHLTQNPVMVSVCEKCLKCKECADPITGLCKTVSREIIEETLTVNKRTPLFSYPKIILPHYFTLKKNICIPHPPIPILPTLQPPSQASPPAPCSSDRRRSWQN